MLIWLGSAHDKTYNTTCATSEDADQPAYPRNLTRVFADHMSSTASGLFNEGWTRSLAILCGCTGWFQSLLVTRLIVGFVVRWRILLSFSRIFFFSFALEHSLWVLIVIHSARRFHWIPTRYALLQKIKIFPKISLCCLLYLELEMKREGTVRRTNSYV